MVAVAKEDYNPHEWAFALDFGGGRGGWGLVVNVDVSLSKEAHNPRNQAFALNFGGDCWIVVVVAARGSSQPPKSSVHT